MMYCRGGSKITVLSKSYYLLRIAQVSPWLHKIMLSVFRNVSASGVGLEIGHLEVCSVANVCWSFGWTCCSHRQGKLFCRVFWRCPLWILSHWPLWL